MGWFGPNSGARDGNKDWKKMTTLRGMDTGSRYDDEKKKAKAKADKEKKAARRAQKQGEKKGWW